MRLDSIPTPIPWSGSLVMRFRVRYSHGYPTLKRNREFELANTGETVIIRHWPLWFAVTVSSFDARHLAHLGHTALVKSFDGKTVVLAEGQCAEFKFGPSVGEDLVALVEFVVAEAP